MQAQQLLQAQQIANILNQQYSSQQNITGMYHPIQQQQFGSTPHLSMKPQHHQYINEQGQYINQKMYSRENSRIIDDQYATPPSQYLNQEKQKNIAKYVQDTNHYRDQYEPQQTQFFLHGDPQTPPQPPARRTWAQQQQQQPKQQPEMSRNRLSSRGNLHHLVKSPAAAVDLCCIRTAGENRREKWLSGSSQWSTQSTISRRRNSRRLKT
jgi:calmodulin-regulated spectrin-associated protein